MKLEDLQNRSLSPAGQFLGRRNSGNCRVLRADGYARSGLAELSNVFAMIQEEYREKGLTFPATPMTS